MPAATADNRAMGTFLHRKGVGIDLRLIAYVVGAAAAIPGALAQPATVTFAPTTQGGNQPFLSGDGRTVVDASRDPSTLIWQVYRWTVPTGFAQLPALPIATVHAWGCSLDASTIFAVARPTPIQSVDWIIRGSTATQFVPPSAIPSFRIQYLSRDGEWVVGDVGGLPHRVSRTGAFDAIAVSGPAGTAIDAHGVSADGSVVSGQVGPLGPAFRWTAGAGVAYINPPNGKKFIGAHISPDGSTIWGGLTGEYYRPYRWRAQTGLTQISAPTSEQFDDFLPRHASGDGSVLAISGQSTYLWTQTTGLVPLTNILSAAGVNLQAYQIGWLDGMSDDARTFFWRAYRPAGQVHGLLVVTIPQTAAVCCRGATCSSAIELLTPATCAASIAGSRAGARFVTHGPCGGSNHAAPCCHADYNSNGSTSIADVFAYLGDYFAGRPWAKTGGDGTGTPSIADIHSYLTAWFAGGC